jgi:predicted dehydrogenase
MTTYGIGIIGFGVMGERFADIVSKHAHLGVTAGWDPSELRRERFKMLLPNAQLAKDPSGVTGHPSVDCGYIASPPAGHPGHVSLALDAGKPVLCEKPLAVDVNVSRDLVGRVQAQRARAAVNFPFASAPAVHALAQSLSRGELGELSRVEIEVAFAAWPRDWQRSGPWLIQRAEGGFTREVISHFLFLTRRLIGPLEVTHADVTYPPDGTSSETALSAKLQSGVVSITISGSVGTTDQVDTNRWTLFGSKGALRLHDWAELSRFDNGAWISCDLGEGLPLRLRAHHGQVDRLVSMIRGEAHGLATFQEALDVQSSVEAMLRGTRSTGS